MKPAALHALFAPASSHPDPVPLFGAVMEFCRVGDRSWMDWLLKQHYYDDEQVHDSQLQFSTLLRKNPI